MSETAVLEQPQAESKPIDWTKAKTLYMSNIPNAEIVSQCGVSLVYLRKRIVKEGWYGIRQKQRETVSQEAAKVVQVITKTTSVGDESIQSAANRFRNGLAKRFDAALATLEGTEPPTSLKAIKAEHEALRPVIENAKVILGLDQATSSSLSLTFLSSVKPSPASPASPELIPVESTKVESNQP